MKQVCYPDDAKLFSGIEVIIPENELEVEILRSRFSQKAWDAVENNPGPSESYLKRMAERKKTS